MSAGQSIIDELQRYPQKWWVRLIVATDAGVRVWHQEAYVNAPDQLAAVTIAIATIFEEKRLKRWDEVNILCDPVAQVDVTPRT
ncbi:MAG: hypothetical protein JSS69_05780 [Acidobacteria bacterium]|nr:hypothetical protein [Acidobacteriota bacterium]MBS1865411.1 hypothetical protein [Acidobacteriota bacterium]